jgi:hypothetical protein
MDLYDGKVWAEGIKVVGSAPHVVGPLMLTAAAAGWWFKGSIEKARRNGLQSIINGRDAVINGRDAQLAGKDAQIAAKERPRRKQSWLRQIPRLAWLGIQSPRTPHCTIS